MGLAEKKAMNEIQETNIPRWQEYLKNERAWDVAYKVDWNAVPTTQRAIMSVQNILSDVTNVLWSMSHDKMTKDELMKNMKNFTVKHDATMGEYDYKPSFTDDSLVITANLETFTISSGRESKGQKGFRTAIEELL